MRRRREKKTVQIPNETLRDLAASWWASLNDSTATASSERENGLRGSAVINSQGD